VVAGREHDAFARRCSASLERFSAGRCARAGSPSQSLRLRAAECTTASTPFVHAQHVAEGSRNLPDEFAPFARLLDRGGNSYCRPVRIAPRARLQWLPRRRRRPDEIFFMSSLRADILRASPLLRVHPAPWGAPPLPISAPFATSRTPLLVACSVAANLRASPMTRCGRDWRDWASFTSALPDVEWRSATGPNEGARQGASSTRLPRETLTTNAPASYARNARVVHEVLRLGGRGSRGTTTYSAAASSPGKSIFSHPRLLSPGTRT